MQHVAKRAGGSRLVTRRLGPGAVLHLFPTDRFTTTYCRVVLERDLGPEATATAVLAEVLQSATARHPTRQALAERLADLYGASLGVGVGKIGDRQLLSAGLEWPTAHVPRARGLLAQGLALLGEVLAAPRRRDGLLDGDLVATERQNHARRLAAVRDEKGRYAARRLIEEVFRGDARGLHPDGRLEDLPGVTPAALTDLHARLLAHCPVRVHLVGDLAPDEAVEAVRRHLLWPRPSRGLAPPRPLAPPGGARARPRRVVEGDDVVQARLLLAFRGRVVPGSPLGAAASLLAGVLGGGAYGRLFRVVREEHGLCYDVGAGWNAALGLLLVQAGVDPSAEGRARRLILDLFREVQGGRLEAAALEGHRQALAHRFATLADDARATVSWTQECLGLGLRPDPRARLAALRGAGPGDVRRVGRRLALDTTFVLAPRRARRGGRGRA